MSEYLLFLDIESSGRPKRWDLPYTARANWPQALQVSWAVFRADGERVKTEDHYIYDPSVVICEKAQRVHRLTTDFLRTHGVPRKDVLNLLEQDLAAYQPQVVGHFIELDYAVLGADYFRIGKSNPLDAYSRFCTMLGTRHLVRTPNKKYLGLEELYTQLFCESFADQHHALSDALATARCYFELVRRNLIHPAGGQHKDIIFPQRKTRRFGCAAIFLFIILIIAILFVYE